MVFEYTPDMFERDKEEVLSYLKEHWQYEDLDVHFINVLREIIEWKKENDRIKTANANK